MNDKDYYARLRKEMEKKKAAQPVKKPTRRKTVNAFVGKSINKAVAAVQNNSPITDDDILNIRISAETSEDVLDFIRRI